jgi:hypothetical protein
VCDDADRGFGGWVVEGTEIWVAAENAYNERVARVENQIIARLRDRLGTARNANEMFRCTAEGAGCLSTRIWASRTDFFSLAFLDSWGYSIIPARPLNMNGVVQNPIPILRSVPHVPNVRLTTHSSCHNLGPSDRTPTPNIHEARRRRPR